MAGNSEDTVTKLQYVANTDTRADEYQEKIILSCNIKGLKSIKLTLLS